MARFVGPDGKPLPKHIPHMEFVATPGPTLQTSVEQGLLARDSDWIPDVDRRHYYPGKKDYYKRVTTENTEGHGKGKLIQILFSVYFGGFRG